MNSHSDRLVREGLPIILPSLRRFALALTLNPADADDLTQAGIERALRKSHLFKPGAKLESWMFKIMQNIWIDMKRSEARKGVHLDVTEMTDLSGEDGRDTLETRAVMNEVRQSIATLPDEQRLVVALVLIEGRSYKEAAEIIDAPIGTIMSRLSRARQRIIDELDMRALTQGAPS